MPQAIRPSAFIDYKQVVEKVENKKTPDLQVETKHLAQIGNMDGWEVLKTYISELRADLNNLNKQMIGRGASFEDIGKNAVIVELADELLTKIVNKVEDARESVENTKK